MSEWRHVKMYILINIRSGNSLLTDGVKSITEPMLIRYFGIHPSEISKKMYKICQKKYH